MVYAILTLAPEDGGMLALRPAPMRLPASFLVIPLGGDAPEAVAGGRFEVPGTPVRTAAAGAFFSGPPLPAGLGDVHGGARILEREAYGARIYARAAGAGVRLDGPERPVDLLV